MSVVELGCRIQQIPAPTFGERQRAEFVADEFRALGAAQIVTSGSDGGIANTCALVRGAGEATGALMVAAHTDTVFPLNTDLSLRHTTDGRIHGPGIGDNSIAVAALIEFAREVTKPGGRWEGPCDIWFVANGAEEGLGDLRGINAALDALDGAAGIPAAVILEGMALGSIYHRGVAVRRYRVTVKTGGGHSWGDFGAPSAIHVLAGIVSAVAALDVPRDPQTTFNVGTIAGGTSVNTIAGAASAEVDLRSESTEEVAALESRFMRVIDDARRENVEVLVEAIGNRPAGAISRDHPLVVAASAALETVGIVPRFPNGSTDANALLSAGVPCVCVGITTGGNAHRTDEWIDAGSVETGMRQLRELLWRAADLVAAGGVS